MEDYFPFCDTGKDLVKVGTILSSSMLHKHNSLPLVLRCKLVVKVLELVGMKLFRKFFFSFWFQDVRFRNRSYLSFAKSWGQHSSKKVMKGCLWCSPLPGIASSITANQHPAYKQARRTGASSPQEGATLSAPHWQGSNQWSRSHDHETEFKLRLLPLINESQWSMRRMN